MKKILVIEDNHLLRENISEILELAGYEVKSAENGKKGVDLAQEFLPDLVVSDVNMPVMDGFEVIKVFRSQESLKIIPFIFLTVKNRMLDLRAGMDLGADDYLSKPFEMDQLLKVVERQLNKRDEIHKTEGKRYDDLKNAVGMPLASVISDPIKNIINLSDLIILEGTSLGATENQEIAKLINSSAQKLKGNIGKILYFYRLEALKGNSNDLAEMKKLTTKYPAKIITSIAEGLAQTFNRSHDLVLQLDEKELLIPEDFLKLVIRELVENAFKYSTRNSAITVSTKLEEPDHYILQVQDHGIGFDQMSTEDIAPYVPLQATQERKY